MENGSEKAKVKFKPHHLPAVTIVLSYVFKMVMIIKAYFSGLLEGDMVIPAERRS